MSEVKKPDYLLVEIVRGVEGLCMYINQYRVAGPKPWGGGTTVKTFKVTREDLAKVLGKE